MGGLFTALFAKLSAIVQWVIDCIKQLAKDGWEMATDVPAWCFDQVLGVVVGALEEIDVSAFDAYSQSWGSLPGEVLNAVAYLGVGQGAAIIMAAIGIRLLLQLIPFTRLGS